MAKSGTSPTHIVPLIAVAALALAAIPPVAARAKPVSSGVETQADANRAFSPVGPANTQGFTVPERRDFPGFEAVKNAGASLPRSCGADARHHQALRDLEPKRQDYKLYAGSGDTSC